MDEIFVTLSGRSGLYLPAGQTVPYVSGVGSGHHVSINMTKSGNKKNGQHETHTNAAALTVLPGHPCNYPIIKFKQYGASGAARAVRYVGGINFSAVSPSRADFALSDRIQPCFVGEISCGAAPRTVCD